VSEAPRVDTKQVADAAEVSRATVRRWADTGLLPLPTVYYGLKPGKHSFWADHAAVQARWVASQIAAGRSFEEMRSEPGIPSPSLSASPSLRFPRRGRPRLPSTCDDL